MEQPAEILFLILGILGALIVLGVLVALLIRTLSQRGGQQKADAQNTPSPTSKDRELLELIGDLAELYHITGR